MSDVNKEIVDATITNSVKLNRIEAGLVRDIEKLYRKMIKDLEKEVNKWSPTDSAFVTARRAKTRKLIQSAKLTIQDITRAQADEVTGELYDISLMQVDFLSSTYTDVYGVDLINVNRSADYLKRLVDGTLIEGAPSAAWWKRQEVDTLNKFNDTVRDGVLRGFTNQQLTAAIKRELDVTRRNANSLVRTSVQTIANEARNDVYLQNQDIIKAIEWMSTFDLRTTVICIGLDGLRWSLPDYEPIGHKKRYPGPVAHWGCRSTQIPQLRSWSELGAVGRVQEMPPGVRSSMDGTIPKTTTYSEWLKGRSKADQVAVLGVKKQEMFERGSLSARQLIDESGRPIRVKDLTAS